MSRLAAVDISDSDRFELAEVLKEESESSSAPRLLEDILQETCDDDFDPMSQRSCYELLAAYIARPIATIVSRNGHSACSNCGTGIPYHVRYAAYCPIEMGGYDSLEQLQRAWDNRCPDATTFEVPEDASDAEA